MTVGLLPDVLMVGPAAISTSALTALIGGLAAYLVAGWPAARDSTAASEAAKGVILDVAIGAVLGAKLVYFLLDPAGHLANPRLLLSPPYGPMALPAGVAGGLAGLLWRLWRLTDRAALLDQVAPAMAVGLAVAALGAQGPGAWAWAPALAAAAAAALVLPARASAPGQRAAASVVLVALALVLADLARPAGGLPGGVSTLQLTAAAAGTGAWLWSRRTA